MEDYLHKVQYYETDQMKIVHHSNYIRWFEEARIDYLDRIGVSYAELEARGVASPVLSVCCEYRSVARFGETVRIETRLTEVGNVRYRLRYTVRCAAGGQVQAVGETSHCFVDASGRVISLKRFDPELFAEMQSHMQPEKDGAAD